jgi:hypothetical protein
MPDYLVSYEIRPTRQIRFGVVEGARDEEEATLVARQSNPRIRVFTVKEVTAEELKEYEAVE